jgi:hypothetical protein
MKESLHGSDGPEAAGEEVLAHIKTLNEHGRFVLFAPNHLTPQNGLSKVFGIPDDYAALKKVLDQHNVSSTVIAKGDTNIAFGPENSALHGIKKTIYQVHQKIFSHLMQKATGGITVSINYKEPAHNVAKNVGAIRKIIDTLGTKDNLVMYPLGNWRNSGEDEFDPETHLDGGNAFVDKKKEFERWRACIKDTFIRLAQKTGAPIVPVYVEYTDNKWVVRFGGCIDAGESTVEVAKKYLVAMQSLKNAGKES